MSQEDRNRGSDLKWIIWVVIFLGLFVFPGLLVRLLAVGIFVLAAIVLARIVCRTIGLKTGIDAIDDFIETGHTPKFGHLQPQPSQIVAKDAMQRARYVIEQGGLRLDDIGLLVYHGKDSEPRIYRTGDVPSDAVFVRPYVMMRRTWSVNVYFPIRFDLIDENWKLVYKSEEQYPLQHGKTFITPGTWLPIREQQVSGQWTLEVSVAGVVIGAHEFGWLQIGGEARTLLNGEGEIDPEASRLTGSDLPLAVDDLLEDQGGALSAEIG